MIFQMIKRRLIPRSCFEEWTTQFVLNTEIVVSVVQRQLPRDLNTSPNPVVARSRLALYTGSKVSVCDYRLWWRCLLTTEMAWPTGRRANWALVRYSESRPSGHLTKHKQLKWQVNTSCSFGMSHHVLQREMTGTHAALRENVNADRGARINCSWDDVNTNGGVGWYPDMW